MPPNKELCRNFQRGSCRYGDRCKFLHATQQQSKPNNSFGFGVQSNSNFRSTNPQQPNTNPFGFGVQNAPQQNGGANFGASSSRQSNAFKPFENKWTRTSSATGGSSTAAQQNQNQSQVSNHKCTNPNDCKEIMAADSEKEQPLWKLTCYGHFKHLPCDISGDTSFEELRAAAYEDARRGMPLQSIVERERNLVQNKIKEFESLLRNPFTKIENSVQPLPSQFPSISQTPNPSLLTTQNHSPSPFSSFGQPATSFGMGSSTSSSMPPSNSFAFGKINNPGQPSTMFGSNIMASGNQGGGFGAFSTNTSTFNNLGMSSQSNSQTPTLFGSQTIMSTTSNSQPSSMASGNQVSLGGQMSTSGGGGFGAFSTNTSNFSNLGVNSQSNTQTPALFGLQNSLSTATNPQSGLSNASGSHPNGFGQAAINSQSLENNPKETFTGDPTIWLKAEWKLGEIPEDAPPVEYIR